MRVLVWFSCGAASAVAAKLATKEFPDCEILYCDTLKYEHPDNLRFLKSVERWIGKKIKIIGNTNPRYCDEEGRPDIYRVFDATNWLIGIGGARCTTELKKKVRHKYQKPDDLHIFGYTYDETMPECKLPQRDRIDNFTKNNPELNTYWILKERKIRKGQCYQILKENNIEIPEMYKLGYKNNNCIGCVKGGLGYWNKIRQDFPEVFNKMAAQERKMNTCIIKKMVDGKRVPTYLDELFPNEGNYTDEPDIECGPQCGVS